ncbi:MAG: hypothetical protein AAGC67_01865 [Myxococcota bacterium]
MIEIEVPVFPDPEHYDQRMATGWFRSGPILVRANLLPLDEQIRGLVQIRLPVDDPTGASRSARRRFRRNRERFRVEFGPAKVDGARSALYEKTKARFMSFVSSALEPLVLGENRDVFDTRECAVFDQDRLVAVSYFDVGREAVAAQLALHDPDYAAYGLGTYTLLEEIDYARTIDAVYYYPGYVVPGQPRFDYKMQIGRVQYLEGSQWRRRATPPRRVRAAERFRAEMKRLGRALRRHGLPDDPKFYAGFWLGLVPEFTDQPYLAGLVVWTLGRTSTGELLLIELTTDPPRYRLTLAAHLDAIDLMEEYDPLGERADAYELRALVEVECLTTGDAAPEIAAAAERATRALDVA